MDQDLLIQFLSQNAKQPNKFLFLFDESAILNELTELIIGDTNYSISYFENDLQLRSQLEWKKDSNDERAFCVIFRQKKEEVTSIPDFFARAEIINISPQVLLNFFSEKTWSESVNWLRGADFWNFLKTVQRIKDRPNLALATSDEAFLASSLLNIDLIRTFDPASGFIFYFKKMQSGRYLQFKTNYPQLAKFVEKKLFMDVPELEELSQSSERIEDFWLGNTENFSQRLNQSERNYDLKYQMTIKVPLFVRDQVEHVEKSYFKNDRSVETYLQTHLPVENWEGWLDYIRKEHFLVQPLSTVLEKIIDYLVKNNEYINLKNLENLLEVLNEHQLVRSQAKLTNPSEHPLIQKFDVTQKIVLLYRHLNQIRQKLADCNFAIQELICDLYPNSLSELPLLFAGIKISHQRLHFLSRQILNKIGADILKVEETTHKLFVDWIEKEYKSKIGFFTKSLPGSSWPFQIIQKHQAEHKEIQIFVLIFDGMRWDGWNMLQPHILRIFRNRKIETHPVLTALPTLTSNCRHFLLTGEFLTGGEGEDFPKINQPLPANFYFHNDLTDSVDFIQSETEAGLMKVLIFDLFDRRIHHTKLGLKMIYREILQDFTETIEPVISQIPEKALIILLADHGFIQVTGKWFPQLKNDLNHKIPPANRRFLTLPEQLADKKHFVYLSGQRLGSREEVNSGTAFLRESKVFKIMPSESYTRYAHGGISLEEMVVPVMVILGIEN